MLSEANVAMPATAAIVVVPDRVAPGSPEPAAIATVTAPVYPSATFPRASRAVTVTAGTSPLPATPEDGCVVNASWLAGPP